MRRQCLGLQNRDSDCRQADANTANDSRNKHLPIVERCSLDRSTDNDDEVCQYDRAFSSNPLAEDESNDSTKRASYIVDGGNETCHRRIGPAESVFEAFAAQNAAEETLIIW